MEEPEWGVVCYSWHCERGVLEGALDRAGGGSRARCILALPVPRACDPLPLEVFPSVKQAARTSLSQVPSRAHAKRFRVPGRLYANRIRVALYKARTLQVESIPFPAPHVPGGTGETPSAGLARSGRPVGRSPVPPGGAQAGGPLPAAEARRL